MTTQLPQCRYVQHLPKNKDELTPLCFAGLSEVCASTSIKKSGNPSTFSMDLHAGRQWIANCIHGQRSVREASLGASCIGVAPNQNRHGQVFVGLFHGPPLWQYSFFLCSPVFSPREPVARTSPRIFIQKRKTLGQPSCHFNLA